ncbi:MAG TPA: DUF3298/DUF4163 domain-containing protein [Clostridiales bacterium]|nr:DUF3298/DUF4163 domain-containing protein [Clostridiales bacterium]
MMTVLAELNKDGIIFNTITIKGELLYNDILLLSYKIDYPEFNTAYKNSETEINMFYKNRAFEYKKHCESELFDAAVRQYRSDMENGYPIRVFEAVSTFSVSYALSCIISLYTDTYEYTGGAHGSTFRDSQTFNLQKGYVMSLSHLVTCSPDYRAFIFGYITEKAAENPDLYFDNYKELIPSTFFKNNFYCTPDGIVIYFLQYDIAPYSSGIMEFLIPYSECVINPANLCISRKI